MLIRRSPRPRPCVARLRHRSSFLPGHDDRPNRTCQAPNESRRTLTETTQTLPALPSDEADRVPPHAVADRPQTARVDGFCRASHRRPIGCRRLRRSCRCRSCKRGPDQPEEGGDRPGRERAERVQPAARRRRRGVQPGPVAAGAGAGGHPREHPPAEAGQGQSADRKAAPGRVPRLVVQGRQHRRVRSAGVGLVHRSAEPRRVRAADVGRRGRAAGAGAEGRARDPGAAGEAEGRPEEGRAPGRRDQAAQGRRRSRARSAPADAGRPAERPGAG